MHTCNLKIKIMGFSILFPFLLIARSAAVAGTDPSPYRSYQSCSADACTGSLIKYPFFHDCGYPVTIHCATNQTILVSPFARGFCLGELYLVEEYRVVGGITNSSYTNRTITVACHENPLNFCSATSQYVNWDATIFYLSDTYKWGTVLICNKEPPIGNNLQRIKCLECRSTDDLCYFLPSELSASTTDDDCRNKYGVIIPSNKSDNISDEKNLRELLRTGFEIKWNFGDELGSCEASGGKPMHDIEVCICLDGPRSYNCSGKLLYDNVDGKPSHDNKWWMTSRFIAAIGVLSGVFITSMIIFISIRINRKKRAQEEEEEQDIRGYMDPLDSTNPSIENFLNSGIPTRYSYRQVKRYTNNFGTKLGQGGYGTVFKGKLPNESMVAVKILDKSKHSRIQFLNEVATIGRIHHLHLVRLLGYCFEGSKRALIYEYMVNGSLEKYIHREDQSVLNWKQLYSIAMGTARGIAYLHDECRSKILHCDIKPHNVLLDVNFFPKVGDFGLAKLTDREESHVFLTGARGTPGYVAPEVWSRSNGPVTDRSDVYSYGMLIMEMVGGRKNFDMKATRSSKFYYPEWAFKQVKMGEFQNLRGENIEDEDEVIVRKLSMLGLWCIQYNPSQRPSMSRVIQMLEGDVAINMPPQPFPVNPSVQTPVSTELSSSSM